MVIQFCRMTLYSYQVEVDCYTGLFKYSEHINIIRNALFSQVKKILMRSTATLHPQRRVKVEHTTFH